ncbi:hypothetical protein ISCGN_018951 [Ixodes scapularis]
MAANFVSAFKTVVLLALCFVVVWKTVEAGSQHTCAYPQGCQPTSPKLGRTQVGTRYLKSPVNLQCEGATFMDPVFPDIYMVTYNIRPESFTFGLSCSKSCPAKNIGKFKDTLQKALMDLRECVDRSC